LRYRTRSSPASARVRGIRTSLATINITYVPDKKVVELKSLKLYLNTFRERAISHEAVTNLIFDDLKSLLSPRRLDVVADFNVRGNVKMVVKVSL